MTADAQGSKSGRPTSTASASCGQINKHDCLLSKLICNTTVNIFRSGSLQTMLTLETIRIKARISLPKNLPYLHFSSDHLYLLTVLTNVEGGCVSKPRFPLQLGSRAVWLGGSAIHGQIACFTALSLDNENTEEPPASSFESISTFLPQPDTMGEVSTPQARCTELPVSTPHRILHTP